MNRHEVETILHASRASGRDASDPQIAEAIAYARQDPELQQWLADWQAYDRAVAAKLKAAALPEGLLKRVRAGATVRASLRRRQHRNLQALALAASLLLLGTLTALLAVKFSAGKSDAALVALRTDMADFLRQFPKFELETDRLPEVRAWLADQAPVRSAVIPRGLEGFPPLGCRTLRWEDQEAALVCFMVDGEVVHLFVLPAGRFPETMPQSTPQYAATGRFTTAAWVAGGHLYLAMTPGGEDTLRKFL